MRPAFRSFLAPLPDDPPGWRRVAGNSLWLLLEKAARWALGLTVGVWMARHLGPADFGVLTATLAWVALFGGAAGFGLEPIVVRELVRRPDDQGAIMATAFGLRCLGGALAAGAAVLGTLLWRSAAPAPTLAAVASLATLIGVGEVFDLWFQAHFRARSAALARTTAFVLACAGRIALILSGAPVSAFVWMAVAEAALISAALGAVFLRAAVPGRMRFSHGLARELLRESWPNAVANLAAVGYIRADRVMLAALAGESSAGFYSAAASLVEIWYILPLAVINSATPWLTELHGSDPDRYRRELHRLTRLHAAAAWLLAIGLAATASWLVPALFGAPYAAGSPALTWLALSLPFTFLGVAAVPWYLNERLTLPAMRRHLIGALLNIALNFNFIPRWGVAGAAGATLFSFAVVHVFANILDPRTRPLFFLQLRALVLRPAPSS